MGRLLRYWAVVPLLAAPATVVDAQDWIPIGPSGGVIDNVAVDPDAPDTVYATGINRLFRSTDGGRRWQQQPVSDAHSIAVASDGRIYVGGGYLSSRSSDGSRTWVPIAALHERAVYALAADPTRPQAVYALADSGPGSLQLLKSSDGAETFAPCCGLLQGTGFVPPRLAVDPLAPGALYALIPARGVFKSVDGADWQPTGPGLPHGCGIAYGQGSSTAPIERDCLLSLTVGPNDGVLYVGTDGHGIYHSPDGGDSWEALGGALAQRAVSAVAVAATDARRLFAGVTAVHDSTTGETIDAAGGPVFRSDDGGASWSDVGDALSRASGNGLAIDPDDIDHVYVATGGVGVLSSRDGGASWQSAEEGLTASCLLSMATAGTMPTTLLTGDAAELPRIFSSGDRGDHWVDTALDRKSLGVFSFVVDVSDPSTIYASELDRTVLKTTDGGRNWWRRDTGFGCLVGNLAIDPGSPVSLYAACGSGVIKSSDGAATWRQIFTALPYVSQVAVDAATGTIYATAEAVAFKSSDGGATWNSITTIPQPFQGLLAVAPTTPATLFATTSTDLYASRDGGDSWDVVHLPGTTFSLGEPRLAVSPANPKTVYAIQETQLLRSDDQGQSWRAAGGLLDEPLNSIAVDANTPDTIYAATCGGGVFALRQTADTMTGSGGDGCSVGSPQPFTARTFLAHVFVMALLLARRTTRNGVRRRP